MVEFAQHPSSDYVQMPLVVLVKEYEVFGVIITKQSLVSSHFHHRGDGSDASIEITLIITHDLVTRPQQLALCYLKRESTSFFTYLIPFSLILQSSPDPTNLYILHTV